jgi:hypothetical protein
LINYNKKREFTVSGISCSRTFFFDFPFKSLAFLSIDIEPGANKFTKKEALVKMFLQAFDVIIDKKFVSNFIEKTLIRINLQN